jgi:hypothetical protein
VVDAPPAEAFAVANWAALRATGLEPPEAARIGEQLGLGPVATEAALVEAVSRAG